MIARLTAATTPARAPPARIPAMPITGMVSVPTGRRKRTSTSSVRSVAEAIDDMQAPDPYTLVMHWKSTFPLADRPEETRLDPVPAHILGHLCATETQGFVNSPYWTREFVGL